MQYQLVLQFTAETLGDFDALVALEQQLIDVLGEAAVDGHDMGSGEANIFIVTSDPQEAFSRVLPELESSARIDALTAAYRRADEDRFHVLWRKNSSRPFAVA